jgi:ABC-2 type transport system permease protein
MSNIKAIFIKQFVSQIKVPTILIMGIMFLILPVILLFLIGEDEDRECDDCIPAYMCTICEEEEEGRFRPPVPSTLGMFSVMFVGLALVSSTSGLVQEEKTTKNLQFMAMADVKPYQYLLGTVPSLMIFVAVMIPLFALAGGYFGGQMLRFTALGIAGSMVAILLGVVIGLSRVPILAMPVSMMLGLGPTFSMHNEALANALRFTFNQQVNIGFAEIDGDLTSNFLVIGANGLVVLVVFFIMHRKNKFNL